MARFLFITDTHFGAEQVGFHQQPAYPDNIRELLDCLVREEIERSGIDFMLHGGDMVDRCEPDIVRGAAEVFRLPVPVYLSLGNHDLTRRDALDIWLSEAPGFFNGRSPQYAVRCGDCVIHIVPNQWEADALYYWHEAQVPYFAEDQIGRLEAAVSQHLDCVHLLSIHNPIFGVSPEQSGLAGIVHAVPDAFRETVTGLVRKHPNIKGVLSGHSHINTLVRDGEAIYASGSSFVETPFEYKVVEVTKHSLRIETRKVKSTLRFAPAYNPSRAFVQGRPQDREAELRF